MNYRNHYCWLQENYEFKTTFRPNSGNCINHHVGKKATHPSRTKEHLLFVSVAFDIFISNMVKYPPFIMFCFTVQLRYIQTTHTRIIRSYFAYMCMSMKHCWSNKGHMGTKRLQSEICILLKRHADE